MHGARGPASHSGRRAEQPERARPRGLEESADRWSPGGPGHGVLLGTGERSGIRGGGCTASGTCPRTPNSNLEHGSFQVLWLSLTFEDGQGRQPCVLWPPSLLGPRPRPPLLPAPTRSAPMRPRPEHGQRPRTLLVRTLVKARRTGEGDPVGWTPFPPNPSTGGFSELLLQVQKQVRPPPPPPGLAWAGRRAPGHTGRRLSRWEGLQGRVSVQSTDPNQLLWTHASGWPGKQTPRLWLKGPCSEPGAPTWPSTPAQANPSALPAQGSLGPGGAEGETQRHHLPLPHLVSCRAL